MGCGELSIVVERTIHAKVPISDAAGRAVSSLFRRDTLQAEFAIIGNVSNKSRPAPMQVSLGKSAPAS